MSPKVWLSILGAAIFYVFLVLVFPFEGFIGLIVNFLRVAVATAVLVIYGPKLGIIFRQVPAPSRDYLLAGIVLSWFSSECFAMYNEAGRIFGIETSIFKSPVAGGFSFVLVSAGVFHLLAPGTSEKKSLIIAVAIGVVVSVGVVFVAPLFR